MRRSLPKEVSKDQPTVNTFMSSDLTSTETNKRKKRSGDNSNTQPTKRSTLTKSPDQTKTTSNPNPKLLKATKKSSKSTPKMSTNKTDASVNTYNIDERLDAMETRMTENITANLKSVINNEMKDIKDSNTQMDTNMNSAIKQHEPSSN